MQRYTNSSSPKTKSEAKSCTPANSKTRPIVLPNKANRTAKIIKPQPSAGNIKQVYHLNQKGLSIENLKKLICGTSAAGDSLSTLTTLTTSSNSSNGKNPDADAVKWLETQGLAMTESDSLVDSALDSGKSLNLTEAGKLTLNWVRNQNVNPSASSSTGPKKIITVNNSSVKGGTPIILVSSASSGHQLESQKLTAMAGNSRRVQQLSSSQAQKIKITKPVTIAMIPNNSVTFTRSSNQSLRNPKQTTVVVNENQSIDLEDEEDEDGDEDSVPRKLLEQERRQFKAQLAEKDREIERLKKQVADLSSKAGKK